ncbi:MAG: lipopolysaccharide export system protein LptC [Parasphingorhabdus sp.]|jgi:lipopolysaccharide export system protein LptC
MNILEKSLLVMALLLFAALTAWLENFSGPEKAESVEARAESHDPDYYIENFVSSGLDRSGRQYILEALRLVHFPDDDTSLVEQPHIIQYSKDAGPRHVYAESGLISADGTEILLSGSVKVIESQTGDKAGHVTTTNRMRVKLKNPPG